MFKKLIQSAFEGAWFNTISAEEIKIRLKRELLSHDITQDREEEVVDLLKLL